MKIKYQHLSHINLSYQPPPLSSTFTSLIATASHILPHTTHYSLHSNSSDGNSDNNNNNSSSSNNIIYIIRLGFWRESPHRAPAKSANQPP